MVKGRARRTTPQPKSLPIAVRARSLAAAVVIVTLGHMRVRAALGRTGRRAIKREGDGATPIGRFRCLQVLYRADRVRRPRTGLAAAAIRREDGWCDAVGDRNYNQAVRHPYPASAERLWRDDGLYDVVVVLDHNRRPRMQGGGSAIFLHVAAPGFTPTAGCIALARRDVLRLLACMGRDTVVRVTGGA